MQRRLVLGSRGSPLALTQARNAQTALCAASGASFTAADERFPIHIVQTTGDLITDRPLADVGGKGLFTKELDVWLHGGGVDVAVHSLKDVPHQLPEGIAPAGVLLREDPRDALMCRDAKSLADLPKGAKLGTSSPRRRAQVLKLRPDLDVVSIRGNVHTRMRKVRTGEVDATILAAAGLIRLGKTHVISEILEPETMLPAACQGIVQLQCMADRDKVLALCQKAEDDHTALVSAAERGFLEGIDGTCHSAVAALAQIDKSTLRLRGQALEPDGTKTWDRDDAMKIDPKSLRASLDDARQMGRQMGQALRQDAGQALVLDA